LAVFAKVPNSFISLHFSVLLSHIDILYPDLTDLVRIFLDFPDRRSTIIYFKPIYKPLRLCEQSAVNVLVKAV